MGVTRRRAVGLMGAGLAGGALVGCGGLVEIAAGPPPNLYRLSPKSTFDEGLGPINWQLLIEEPLAAGGLDTDRIALRPSAYEIKYFADVRWADRAPRMVETLLVESFENSERITSVGRRAVGLRADLSLKSELREFQAEYIDRAEGEAPMIRVRLNAKIVKQRDGEIVASENFERTSEAEADEMQAILTAFDEALGGVLRRVVEWTLETGQRFDPNEEQEDRLF